MMRQRADLTHKHNSSRGRHGWLRLTPAYSVRLVESVLAEFGLGAKRLFEPFSGTGTTALCAAYRGLDALAGDINPFLLWLGRVKSARYSAADRAQLEAAGDAIATRLCAGAPEAATLPAIRNIERWWNPPELAFLQRLRAQIQLSTSRPLRDLLDLVFCRTVIALSNAAFNHQSMSFKVARGAASLDAARDHGVPAFAGRFSVELALVAGALGDNPSGSTRFERLDARALGDVPLEHPPFDVLITSPPYPNRMSYIRELRPYMYWLGFLEQAREAGELDWEAVGGTWGIATSRLATWRSTGGYVPAYLRTILDQIRAAPVPSGALMARYVEKYFDDMFRHFCGARSLLRPGGTAHYIVGNSNFYGHLVPTERIYCDQLSAAGFKHVEARPLRKRNSKKDLIEYHVVAVV